MKFSFVIFFNLLVLNGVLFSLDKSKIEFDANIRERFELWDGMNAKNYGDDSSKAIGSLDDKILYQRLIAGFVFHPDKSVNLSAHLQDSRAFGWSLRNSKEPDAFKIRAKNTERPYYIMNPGEEFFEIYDLYIEYKFIKNLSFKMGRQKISYGDDRIFGPGEWGNTGRWTWDSLKVSYKDNSNFIDVFVGGTKIHEPKKISIPFENTEFWGGGLYSHYELEKIGSIEPFYAIKKEGSADYANTFNFTRQWLGSRLFSNDLNNFVYDFTFAKEFGDESGKSIDAYGMAAKLGYQFNNFKTKPLLALRESYASGGKKTDSKIKTFDPIYGSKDKYYGWMNITSWSNLDDREILTTFFPLKDIKIAMNYHWFYIPEPQDLVLLGTMKLKEGKDHLGNEFDIFTTYQVSKKIQLIGAFGYFVHGDLQPINNNNPKNASWFALQFLYYL